MRLVIIIIIIIIIIITIIIIIIIIISSYVLNVLASNKSKPGVIIRDGDRKRGVHANPCVVPKSIFLEKIRAPPFTS